MREFVGTSTPRSPKKKGQTAELRQLFQLYDGWKKVGQGGGT